ncbi:hypothetical protein ACFLSQ_06755 [Bacteroidota bacterium]
MTKCFTSMKILTVLFMILILASVKINAQWDCRSMLGAHLSPLYEKAPVSWAGEITMASGLLDGHRVTNSLLIFGIDFDFGSGHQMYLEGGYKNYMNILKDKSQSDKLKSISNNGLGFREVFYRYFSPDLQVTAGLQTMTLGDFFLLDERVLGFKYKQDVSSFSINVSLGTVQKDFARMGDFCGTRKMFYMVKGTKSGDNLGETNFFGTVISWDLSKKVDNEKSENDEFESFDEFSEFEESEPFFDQIGIVFYNEFGSLFKSPKYYYGAGLKVNFPGGIDLEAEVLGQYDYGNRAAIIFLESHKNITWTSMGNTAFEAGIIGKIKIDEDAVATPSFSNLYIGEVYRLDTRDIPIVYASVKHMFPWSSKFFVKAKFIRQIKGKNLTEIDLEASFRLFKHLKLTPMLSKIISNPLNEDMLMVRLEARLAI